MKPLSRSVRDDDSACQLCGRARVRCDAPAARSSESPTCARSHAHHDMIQRMEAALVKSVCVFCGSNVGRDPAYLKAAVSAGEALARAGLTLVYGGGKVGLMGAVADAALASGGRVVGVMPRALFEREIAHSALSELRVVETMHERKQTMASLADGFLALPGGAGTFEEFFEQWTWAQLGIHGKPVGLLDVNDYFRPLLALIDKIV